MCAALPAKITVITGWRSGDEIRNVVSTLGELAVYPAKAMGGSYSGTGDLFAAALCGYLLQGVPTALALSRITVFLEACLRDAQRLNLPPEEGVPFELHLNLLMEGV
jgi:pyridoxine kinase